MEQIKPEQDLATEIDRIMQDGALGTSGRLYDLFSYLAKRSLRGETPKEIEIVGDVFSRSNDASEGIARVYIHRLRRKLDQYYINHPSPNGTEITLLKGEYKLVLKQGAGLPNPAVGRKRFVPSWQAVALCMATLALLNIAGWAIWNASMSPEALLRRDPVWRPIASSNRAVTIVDGDYYMFGDYDDGFNVTRLIRDFNINSKDDLLTYLLQNPKSAGSYGDVNLTYLPASAGNAIANVARVIPDRRNVEVTPASTFKLPQFFSNDVVYVGLTSGMHVLEQSAFRGARFTVGSGYDEIIDGKSHIHYVSQNPLADQGDKQTDYGLISAYPGPRNTRVLIITGTRDPALISLSRYMSVPHKDLEKKLGGATNFEALFKVEAQGTMPGPPTLIAWQVRDTATIWSAN